MARRGIPLTRDRLFAAFQEWEVFNTAAFLDVETGKIVDVAEDLIAYCQGSREGTDLQLSDSHELPEAQAIAEERGWLERGEDQSGLPFGEEDRRFIPLRRMGGTQAEEIASALNDWLEQWGLETRD